MFDARLFPFGLTDADLATLVHFGVRGGLLFPPSANELEQVRLGTTRLVEVERPRLSAAGLEVVSLVGVPLSLASRKGVKALVAELPRWLDRPFVAAVGPLQLVNGSDAELELAEAQLTLAQQLSRPVVLTPPLRRLEAGTARLLSLVRTAGLDPGRVLIDGLSPRTVRSVLAQGHLAGLTLHPDRLGVDVAEQLVHSLGPERLVLGSGAGDGASDLLALPRLLSRLKQARLSAAVRARVSGSTVQQLLGLRRR